MNPILQKKERGRFIVLEGPDGAGKSTQVEFLKERLEKEGLEVLSLREPGGTATGEIIRELLLDKKHKKISAVCETFLFQAARSQLVSEAIRPALEKGSWVISDRFTLSTLIYQGYGSMVDPQAIVTMSELATDGLEPDLYFVLWISAEESIRRRRGRPKDRMESKGLKFLQEVSESYRKIVSLSREDYVLIKAEQPIESVSEEIWKHVQKRLPCRGTE